MLAEKEIVKKNKGWRIYQWLLVGGGVLFLLGMMMITIHYLVYKERVIPHVWVEEVEISNLKQKEVEVYLEKLFQEEGNEIELVYPDGERERLADLGVKRDWQWTSEQAMTRGRSGNPLTQIKERWLTFWRGNQVEIPLDYETDGLDGVIEETKERVEREVVRASLVVKKENGERVIKVSEGEEGRILKEKELKENILKAWRKPGKQTVEIGIEKVETGLRSEAISGAIEVANKWLEKEMVLFYKNESLVLKEEEILELIGLGEEEIQTEAYEKIYEELRLRMEKRAENAIFDFEEGRVVEFKPEVVGVVINKEELREEVAEALKQGRERLEVKVKTDEPEVKAGEINDLGIKELVGRGESTFYHSIVNRVFNVALAASRLNHQLIAPGEVFSLNQALGEVSGQTGYRSAYVIKDGKTVLGDGGGVCQVSTTMFRAAMAAGLPITERRAHAYRVGYYEQDAKAGLDATVYAPSTDFKFKNDTENYLLIQTVTDTKNYSLKIDLYGTSDGRVAEIGEPRVFGLTPPPEDLYVDDPTLPVGTVKQIDWAAWGATSVFDYTVKKDGEVITEKTFYSVYKPWQAVFLRGTQV